MLPPSIEDVKALAVVRAISFAAELGFSSIIIEGDLEVVIKALKSGEESFATYGHLISAAHPTIEAFSYICFSHTRRQDNAIVHNLSRHAGHVGGYLVWMKDVPSYLQNVLLANLD